MNLTRLCVSKPVLVTMIIMGLAGIGLFSMFQLPKALFPEVDFPVVTVTTFYEGAGPDEVEQLISKELEDEISSVEGIKHLRSISQQGLSLVMIEFRLGMDVDVAAADVRAKVDLVRQFLPEEAEDPVTMKFDFNAQPIMQISVSAPRSLREVFQMADQRIKDRLATVPDVASVQIIGGEDREIHILTNQQRLRANGVSITDIAAAIAAANLETPGGHIQQNAREYNIRLRGKFTDLDQIRNLRLVLPGQDSVYLRDIADVQDIYKDIREKARADGKVCVGMSIQERAGGNTIAVDKGIREQIKELQKELPEDYKIRVQVEMASWITSSIANVRDNMFIGIILTAVALFIFLHSFRSMLIISLTMPISVLATFIVMYGADINLNMMSLMGLAMTVGVLVNNAILVLENIVRYMGLGYESKEAAVKGTNEIAIAVASTTLTNVVVFVPIAFMGGIVGQFFKDFGLTATFATIISLFISFTLAPMMASRLLGKKVLNHSQQRNLRARFARWFDGGLENLKQSYAQMLRWCLRHRATVIILVFLLFVGSVLLVVFGLIGFEFITPMDQGQFMITVEMPTGTRLEETDRAVQKIEETLRNPDVLPELVSIYSTIGSLGGGDVGGASQAVNIAQCNVTIVEKKKRRETTKQVMNRLRPQLGRANIPGARIKLLEISGGGGAQAPIQMEVIGENMESLRQFSARAMEIIADPELVPGAIDVDTNYRLGQPEIHILPDREKCRDNHVDTRYLSQVVAASFEGFIISEYREGAFNYDIRVCGDQDTRRTVGDVETLSIINRLGESVPLPEVATITTIVGPSQLFRKNRQSMITISCDTQGVSSGQVAASIKKQMEPLLEEFPDCNIVFAGDIEWMLESFQRLGVALIMAICLTYMLLASLLESFTQPFVIMVSLPLSLIGVFAALFLMGGTFSIFSIMSIIMLVGLVINNSIIVIDYINRLRRQGKERTEAIVEAGTVRLRPILMANLTTVVAMIPLALGLGWGGEMRAPMAMVQIGGLIAGGWIGLLVVPVIYTLTEDFGKFLKPIFYSWC